MFQIGMTLSYMLIIMYIIYFVKRCQEMIYAADKVDIDLLWILIEMTHWFISTFVGMGFLGFAHLVRMDPLMRDHDALESDDNPWNNKDTEDFLRHLKEEYFMFQYTYTMTIVDILVTMCHSFFWIDFTRFGPKDFWIAGMLGIICVIPRLYWDFIFVAFSILGIEFRGKDGDKWAKIGLVI